MGKLFSQCAIAALLTIVPVFCNCTYADIVIEVGDHTLLANTAGQQVDILVSSAMGDPQISGINLHAEIGDGTGSGAEPVFNGAQGSQEALVLSGTIFDGELPSGQSPATGAPSVTDAAIVPSSNIVPNGVLISLLIDTTVFGTPGASYDLNLAGHTTAGLTDTELLGPVGAATPVAVTINNGSINIAASAVPEPTAVTLLALGAIGMTARRRRS